MRPEILAKHKSEMAFFKGALERYNALLDQCGDIHDSLALLKKKLQSAARTKLTPAKWSRLSSALMSGEVTRGKKSTPGDWAAQELKLFRAERSAE